MARCRGSERYCDHGIARVWSWTAETLRVSSHQLVRPPFLPLPSSQLTVHRVIDSLLRNIIQTNALTTVVSVRAPSPSAPRLTFSDRNDSPLCCSTRQGMVRNQRSDHFQALPQLDARISYVLTSSPFPQTHSSLSQLASSLVGETASEQERDGQGEPRDAWSARDHRVLRDDGSSNGAARVDSFSVSWVHV